MADVVIRFTENEMREMVRAMDHRGSSSGKTKILRAYDDIVRARVREPRTTGEMLEAKKQHVRRHVRRAR